MAEILSASNRDRTLEFYIILHVTCARNAQY